MDAIDFFCGAGGLTRGLQDAGVNVLAGFDMDVNCRSSYNHNNPKSQFHQVDIRDVSLSMLRRTTGARSFRSFLFAGCAPCQPFSQHRKSRSRTRDATLLGEFGRIIQDALPRAVVVENVPGMAQVQGNSTYRRFLRLLCSCSYEYAYNILDAKHYGVPQTRRRLVLIALRQTAATLPPPKYGASGRPFRTVRDAISHFPRLAAGEACNKFANHVSAPVTAINLRRLKATPCDGGDRRAWPDSLKLTCHSGGHRGHTDVYGRMAWDTPAPTLTGRCHSISNGRYGHPEQDRAISLREAAALQSFPDRYEFFGYRTHIAQQIGNAVPVRFAEALGRHISRLAA